MRKVHTLASAQTAVDVDTHLRDCAPYFLVSFTQGHVLSSELSLPLERLFVVRRCGHRVYAKTDLKKTAEKIVETWVHLSSSVFSVVPVVSRSESCQ